MTEPSLRDLFDHAVSDEPAGPPLETLVAADVARGRRRRRARRIRQAAGAGAIALAVTGAVVVSNHLPDADRAFGPTDRPDQSHGESWNSDLLDDVDAAVTDALPDDVAILGASGQSGSHGTTRTWELERGATQFEMTVVVDAAHPDLESYDLCSDPSVVLWSIYSSSRCSAERDDHGRWQIVATSSSSVPDVVVLENSTTAVMTSLTSRSPGDSSTPLRNDEAIAVTEAALDAAGEYPTEEYASGIDHEGFIDMQEEIATAVGDAMDIPLSTTGTFEPVEVENPWSFAYRLPLHGPDRTEIVVTLWERPRMYEMWCLGDPDVGQTCDIGPTRSAYSVNGRVWSAPVGVRGGLDISIERANNYRMLPSLTLHEVTAIADLIPMLEKGDVSPEQ